MRKSPVLSWIKKAISIPRKGSLAVILTLSLVSLVVASIKPEPAQAASYVSLNICVYPPTGGSNPYITISGYSTTYLGAARCKTYTFLSGRTLTITVGSVGGAVQSRTRTLSTATPQSQIFYLSPPYVAPTVRPTARPTMRPTATLIPTRAPTKAPTTTTATICVYNNISQKLNNGDISIKERSYVDYVLSSGCVKSTFNIGETLTITAKAPGHATSAPRAVKVSSGMLPVNFFLVPNPTPTSKIPVINYNYKVSGTVKDIKGAPISGVKVVANGTLFTATTGSDGSYVLNFKSMPNPYTVTLQAGKDGFTTAKSSAITFSSTTTLNKTYNFTLVKPGTTLAPTIPIINYNYKVSGTVKDIKGAPISGVKVAAAGTLVSGTTASDGTYSLTFKSMPNPYTVTLQAGKDGFTTAKSSAITFSSTTTLNKTYNFTLVKPGTTTAPTPTKAGNGVLKGTIYLVEDGKQKRAYEGENVNVTLSTQIGIGSPVSTLAKNGGSYSFTGLNPTNTYSVKIAPPSTYEVVSPNPITGVKVPSASNSFATENFEIKLRSTAGPSDNIIKGIVFNDANRNKIKDSSETTVSGVKINLSRTASKSVTTGITGAYQFGSLAPGDYDVRATVPSGWQQTTSNIGVSVGGTTKNVTRDFGIHKPASTTPSPCVANDLLCNPTPAPKDYKITGTVKDKMGAAISGVKVVVDGYHDGGTTTNAKGEYTLLTTKAGTFTLSASKTGFTTSKSSALILTIAKPSAVYNFTLIKPGTTISPSTGTINGYVWIDANNNGSMQVEEETLSGIKVSLKDAPLIGISAVTTNALGLYTFSNMATNKSYTFSAVSGTYSGSRTMTLTTKEANGINIQLKKASTTTPTPATKFTLSGKVVDEAGKPLSGVSIVVLSEKLDWRQVGTGTTLTNGTFSFPSKSLSYGIYRVTFSKSGYTDNKKTFLLDADLSLNIIMRKPGVTPGPCIANPLLCEPTKKPTAVPTKKPGITPIVTKAPTKAPTAVPPTKKPTTPPTKAPTSVPTKAPTAVPPTKKPTAVITKQPTTPPTKAPSPTVSDAPTAVPTGATPSISQEPSPSASPSPTVVVPPTVFQGVIRLNGIGSAGDSTNPTANSLSNKNPEEKSIEVRAQFYNKENVLVADKTQTFNYNPSGEDYRGNVDLGKDMPSGDYKVLLSTKNHLRKLTQVVINSGSEQGGPIVALVSGDANNDNVLDILDYNILVGCYSDYAPAIACNDEQMRAADFNDDGKVNQFDYNLFLRELRAGKGDDVLIDVAN